MNGMCGAFEEPGRLTPQELTRARAARQCFRGTPTSLTGAPSAACAISPVEGTVWASGGASRSDTWGLCRNWAY